MAISYKKLWELYNDHHMEKVTCSESLKLVDIQLTKLNKDEPVSLEARMRICKVFHCDIGDVAKFSWDSE